MQAAVICCNFLAFIGNELERIEILHPHVFMCMFLPLWGDFMGVTWCQSGLISCALF